MKTKSLLLLSGLLKTTFRWIRREREFVIAYMTFLLMWGMFYGAYQYGYSQTVREMGGLQVVYVLR